MELKYENLEGREWIINRQDCFNLAIDFFKQNFDIDIPNYARPNDWNADNLDLIGQLHKRSGFEKLAADFDQLRPADVLCCAIRSSVPNHLVIYLGDNMILHHLFAKTSCAETLRPYWRMVTGYILRHKDVPDLTPVRKDSSLEEILRARYRL